MKINPSTGKVTWKLKDSDIGEHKIIISADDGHQGITEAEFTITIK